MSIEDIRKRIADYNIFQEIATDRDSDHRIRDVLGAHEYNGIARTILDYLHDRGQPLNSRIERQAFTLAGDIDIAYRTAEQVVKGYPEARAELKNVLTIIADRLNGNDYFDKVPNTLRDELQTRFATRDLPRILDAVAGIVPQAGTDRQAQGSHDTVVSDLTKGEADRLGRLPVAVRPGG